jgi:putative ABC transport system permease protein
VKSAVKLLLLALPGEEIMKVIRYLRVAFGSIQANKMRAILTMLGIIIGVAAVMTTMGIGAGASASITADILSQGVDKLTVSAGGSGQAGGGKGASTLTLGDAEALAETNAHPEIVLVAPEYSASATLVNGDKNSTSQVVGITPVYVTVNNMELSGGRTFTQAEVDDWQKVTILGATLAKDLFGSVDSVGKEVRIGNDLFTVVGLLKKSGGRGFGSNDDRAFVPLTVAQGRLFNAPRYRGTLVVTGISLQVKDSSLMDAAELRVEQTLRLRHGLKADDKNDFTIANQASLLEVASSITQTLTIFLGSIGAISLLVGGIGIMNIMLVSVTERTKEIGLRKALGAHDSDILLQFMVEALVLCLIGGVIGSAISFGIGALISSIPNFAFKVIIQPSAIELALGVCTACGFVFGLYPALRATRLDPIESLRYE